MKYVYREPASFSWPYLAGVIDSDGCIGTTTTGRNRNIVGRVTIANTNVMFLELLKAELGGTVSRRERGSKPGWKPFASITWSNRQALWILEHVSEHMLIKRTQAELCMRLVRMRDIPKPERHAYVRVVDARGHNRAVPILHPEIDAQERGLADEIRQLNRRGVAA